MVEYPKYQNRIEFFGKRGAIRIEHRGELFLGLAGENDWTPVETDLGKKIQTGIFGADMKVELLNDGPVTIVIDTKNKE